MDKPILTVVGKESPVPKHNDALLTYARELVGQIERGDVVGLFAVAETPKGAAGFFVSDSGAWLLGAAEVYRQRAQGALYGS